MPRCFVLEYGCIFVCIMVYTQERLLERGLLGSLCTVVPVFLSHSLTARREMCVLPEKLPAAIPHAFVLTTLLSLSLYSVLC